MSLRDRLESAKKPLKPAFEQWIDTALSDADREALIEAATDPELSNMAIVEAVRGEGYSANKDTISRWRKSHGFTR